MLVLKITLHAKYILLLSFIFGFQACQKSPVDEEWRNPNIVLIFIDDMGYADVSSFGATDYTTPHIDKLANEGVRFTNFYASQALRRTQHNTSNSNFLFQTLNFMERL